VSAPKIVEAATSLLDVPAPANSVLEDAGLLWDYQMRNLSDDNYSKLGYSTR
jgi:hypothetical protein